MRKITTLIVSGLLTATAFATVATTVEEDGSGRVAGIVYCLPGALCQD